MQVLHQNASQMLPAFQPHLRNSVMYWIAVFCEDVCIKYLCILYLYQSVVVVCIYIPAATNTLARFPVLVQKILDDHDTKPIVQSRHNLRTCHRRLLRVSYIYMTLRLKIFF